MESHEFEMFGGTRYLEKDKREWPDFVSMKIPVWYAWNIVQTLLVQLKEGEKVCDISVCGKLKINVPDE